MLQIQQKIMVKHWNLKEVSSKRQATWYGRPDQGHLVKLDIRASGASIS